MHVLRWPIIVAGSQDAFVGLMNSYVNALGLKNTHFGTVHGLDAEGQYSSARDMALIGQALIRDVPERIRYLQRERVHLQQYPPDKP